jgi:hypothetical protein
MNQNYINSLCSSDTKNEINQKIFGSFQMYMIDLAQYYDYKSEYIIDNNMCTNVCPCYS